MLRQKPCPRPVRAAAWQPLASWRQAVVLLALLSASGCQSFGATAYNLRVLHEPDGSLAPRSATVAHWYYRWLSLTGDRPTLDNPAGDPRVLSRPRTKIRTETVRLVAHDPEGPAERIERLALGCFLATRDRSPVTRELALDVVAESASRWDLEALPTRPVAAPGESDLAAARALLGLTSGPASSDLSALDLPAVLGLLDELLPALRKRPRDRGLLEAEARLSRRASGLALAQALEDPQDLVRSRAARAVLRFDTAPLESLLASALERDQPETVQAVCEHLVERGWPPEASAGERRYELLVAAVDAPDDRASVAAARALTRLTDGVLVSLRPEEWLLWWEQRRTLADSAAADLQAVPEGPAGVPSKAPAPPDPAPPDQDDGQ